MMRDDVIAALAQLPPTADVVVRLGGLQVDLREIRYTERRDSIVLQLDPDDVRDSLTGWLGL